MFAGGCRPRESGKGSVISQIGGIGLSSSQTQMEGLVVLLMLASVTTVFARWLRTPYSVAWVLVGLIASAFGVLNELRPTGATILLIFLPPLLFEAAMNFDLTQLRRGTIAIVLLAVPGVVVSAVLIGLPLAALGALAVWPALVFGALISSTDPVSVVALFRSLGCSTKLTAIMEGESVLNDGTAVALSTALLAAATTGRLQIATAAFHFTYAVIVGAGVGIALGYALSHVTRLLDDHLVETTLSTALAYGSYLLSDSIGASGIIAVVCAGLIFGSYGRRSGLSKTSREFLDAFWSYLAFLANAFLFILIGLSVRVGALFSHIEWVVAAIIIVLAARAIVVYTVTLTLHRISLRHGHILFWGGLRGGVAVAIALSLPASLPGRGLILTMTFGVVLFTILVQGLTVEPLARHLNLLPPRARRPRPARVQDDGGAYK